MRYFFVAPLVPTDNRDPEHFDLRRLDHQQHGLQVAAAGAGAILIDDDFATRLRGGETGYEYD